MTKSFRIVSGEEGMRGLQVTKPIVGPTSDSLESET